MSSTYSPYQRRLLGSEDWEPCQFADMLDAIGKFYPLRWRTEVLARLEKGHSVQAGGEEFRVGPSEGTA